MGDVVEKERAIRLSISSLASEFGVSRETAAKRLAQANVEPDGKRNGYGVYRIGPAARAILGSTDAESTTDPAKMRPTDRRAHFQAENDRLDYETKCGHLVQATEVAFEMRTLIGIVVRSLETLPDRIERDTRCSPEVTEYVIEEVRSVRAEMAKALREDADEDVRESA